MRCDPLSFLPGEGPFRARGLVYKGYLESIESRSPGGLAALKPDLPPAVGEFLHRIFLASTYYDQGPLIHLVVAAARRAGVPLATFIRDRCRKAARHDVATVYAQILKTTSPEAMAERLPRIFERYFEPCRCEVVEASTGRLRVRFNGLPEPSVDWYVWSNQGFMGQSLELAGAVGARVEPIDERDDGTLGRLRLRVLTVEASWSTA